MQETYEALRVGVAAGASAGHVESLEDERLEFTVAVVEGLGDIEDVEVGLLAGLLLASLLPALLAAAGGLALGVVLVLIDRVDLLGLIGLLQDEVRHFAAASNAVLNSQ